mmetsp:Transcript_12378/g.26746  ORF Transcript_12378/g.26746 Transcript_12378/m.26746 type:complete len:206 (-) Transcript_12378:871-1488(-)
MDPSNPIALRRRRRCRHHPRRHPRRRPSAYPFRSKTPPRKRSSRGRNRYCTSSSPRRKWHRFPPLPPRCPSKKRRKSCAMPASSFHSPEDVDRHRHRRSSLVSFAAAAAMAVLFHHPARRDDSQRRHPSPPRHPPPPPTDELPSSRRPRTHPSSPRSTTTTPTPPRSRDDTASHPEDGRVGGGDSSDSCERNAIRRAPPPWRGST